jgi:hypothetical protein
MRGLVDVPTGTVFSLRLRARHSLHIPDVPLGRSPLSLDDAVAYALSSID